MSSSFAAHYGVNPLIELYSYPSNQGVKCGGQPAAPEVLIPLIERLGRELGVAVTIAGTRKPPELAPEHPIERITGYRQPPLPQRDDVIPMGLGGDHSIAYAHASTCVVEAEVGCLWVDAHGDFNDPQSSPSGNAHGMVLAAMSGAIPGLPPILNPAQSVIWGVRSLDAGERERITSYGVSLVEAITDVETVKLLDDRLPRRLYLSLDVDAMDPIFTPATGTPVPGGFEPDQLGRSLQTLLTTRTLVGLDLVELDPTKPGIERTLDSVERLLRYLLPVIRNR